MEKHIEKLKNFIKEQDPEKVLNTITQDDYELKEVWSRAKSNQEWIKIKSYKNVIEAIDYFEKYVVSLPKDIQSRNIEKPMMLIAKYKALRALRKWYQNAFLNDPNFPELTEEVIDNLISRMEIILDKLNHN